MEIRIYKGKNIEGIQKFVNSSIEYPMLFESVEGITSVLNNLYYDNRIHHISIDDKYIQVFDPNLQITVGFMPLKCLYAIYRYNTMD